MCPPDDYKHSFSITSSFGLQKERDILDDDTEELDELIPIETMCLFRLCCGRFEQMYHLPPSKDETLCTFRHSAYPDYHKLSALLMMILR